MTEVDLDAYWEQLLTTALLGVERREPPPPPHGPVGEVVADAFDTGAAARLLTEVAVTAAVRRAAFVPDRPVPMLAPPAHDPRPECPPAAVETWRRVRDDWPVLDDEWVVTAIIHGWRIPAEVAVVLLQSSRRDPPRRERARAATGPMADWLLEHVPGLGAPPQRARTAARGAAANDPAGSGAPDDASSDGVARAVLDLPELAMPPDLAELLDADVDHVVGRLVPDFEAGRIGAAHRPVLINFVARCRPDVLTGLADRLDQLDRWSASAATGVALADLARLRSRMLAELAPPPDPPTGPHAVTPHR